MQARDAWDRAADCAVRADKCTDERMRVRFTKLRDSWIRVANGCELMAPVGADHEPPKRSIAPPATPSGGG